MTARPVLPPGFAAHWLSNSQRCVEELNEIVAQMRTADELMRPETFEGFRADPLSFGAILEQRIRREQWQIVLRTHEIGDDDSGYMIYDISAQEYEFCFAVYCRAPGDKERIGRISDDEFDFYSTLRLGHPPFEELQEELQESVTKVWKGRANTSTLGWSFANRSNRQFNLAINALVANSKLSVEEVRSNGGYLIRNAGFYGNGRHGTLSWASLDPGHPLAYPYHMDLFTLFMYRICSFDLVNLLAQHRNPDAARLPEEIGRCLGVGNSSGVGTVAALIRWPTSIAAWVFTREFLLAYAKTRRAVPELFWDELRTAIGREAADYAPVGPKEGRRGPDHGGIVELNAILEKSWVRFEEHLAGSVRPVAEFLDLVSQHSSTETFETVVSLVLNMYKDVAWELFQFTIRSKSLERVLEPSMELGYLSQLIEEEYSWALGIDFRQQGQEWHFWYKSTDNSENRRGERAVDPGLENETFVNVAGAVQDLKRALAGSGSDETVAELLLSRPELRMIVSRVQLAKRFSYYELNVNFIARGFKIGEVIRFFLSYLGLQNYKYVSEQWVQGVFFQGSTSGGYDFSRLPDLAAAGLSGKEENA